MKNIIIAILVGVIILISGVSVYAATESHKILTIDQSENSVSTFWHDGNRCYVVRGSGKFELDPVISSSISCVRYK